MSALTSSLVVMYSPLACSMGGTASSLEDVHLRGPGVAAGEGLPEDRP